MGALMTAHISASELGDGAPASVIAGIAGTGLTHNGSVKTAVQLFEFAADVGAKAVKPQSGPAALAVAAPALASPVEPLPTHRLSILAIADSDSHVKWGAALLGQVPDDWQRSLIVLASPVLPSGTQLVAALNDTADSIDAPLILDLAALAVRIAALKPDVVLLSVRGSLVTVVVRAISGAVVVRPVIVSGLPGISIPATTRAIAHRAQVDLFVLHSRREVREFAALAAQMGVDMHFGLSTLPFLPLTVLPQKTQGRTQNGEMIFATQAEAPAGKADRLALVSWLAESARRHPYLRVVVKVRETPGEQRTHAERYDYADLIGELDPPAPHNLVVADGDMSDHLAGAAGLVTVSSTAAIEAIARSIPVIIVEDFGVSAELVNTVFEGSGLFGNCGDLVEGRFRHPNVAWLEDNYFHAAEHNDWITGVEELLRAQAAGHLPLKQLGYGKFGGVFRRAWDRKRALGRFDRSWIGLVALVVGMPARYAVMLVRRLRGRRAPAQLSTDHFSSRHTV
jgi:hypothetical protein